MTIFPAVAVTGIGMVTSIGTGRQSFWNAILAGHCGVGPVRSFDTQLYDVHIGAEVSDFRPQDYLVGDPATMGRTSQLAIASSRLALQDVSFNLAEVDRNHVGVCVGTTSGEPQYIERSEER